jgi:hypothetical protein
MLRQRSISPPVRPLSSPSRPDLALDDHPRPGVQGASFGIMRRWLLSGWGGEKHPAAFCGDPPGTFGNGFSPADAARAHRPEPLATNRDSVEVKGGKIKILDKSGLKKVLIGRSKRVM